MPKQLESLVLISTDHHYGKKTRTYDTAIFRARMTRLGARLDDIAALLRPGYAFEEFVLGFLGDVVDGQDIFPTQSFHQDVPDAVEQAEQWSTFMAEWVEARRRSWKIPVRVEAVCGNHGRSGKRAKESSSFDRVAYNQLAAKLKSAPVTIGMDDDPFFCPVTVQGHKYLFYHGHEIKSSGDVSLQNRALLWHPTHDIGGFEQMFLGHFHSWKELEVNGIETMLTGTMVTDDTYGRNSLGKKEANRWRLFGVSEKFARTFSFDLHVGVER